MEHEIFLYPYSKAEAGRRGELDRWEESFRANVSCAREIEAAIRIEDTSILDFIRYALQFFVLRQQTYDWGIHTEAR